MWRALENSPMSYIGFRHEQSAAHAADGYGRVTGKPGAVMLSTGPGALNAASALAEADVSSSPVIAVASAIPTKYLGKRKGFLHETTDLAEAFGAVTRHFARVAQPNDVPELLAEVMGAALGGRCGPAMLEIPADLFDAPLDAPPLEVVRKLSSPSADQILDAALLVGLAARPVIWAGGGVASSEASLELQALAEKISAPVITTFMGKGAIPESHPLAVGSLVRQPEVADLLREADVLLAVGTRFSGMDTSNWKLELPSQLIHIDIDAEEIGRNYPVRLGIAADARASLIAIAEAIETAPIERGGWGKARVSLVRDACSQRAKKEGPLEWELLRTISSSIGPQDVTVHDMTVPSYWSAPFLGIEGPRRFLYPYGYGSLGFSLPAAIGAAAAGRKVFSFSGDGGFQYHCRELATIVQHDLPITALVFNDGAWGVLKAFSQARYGSDLGMALPGPDFMKLADAYGIPSARVAGADDLAVALGKYSKGPSLIEVTGQWALPPPSEYYR